MKLNSIQFLRAVAVLLVTYNHSIDIQMQYGVSWQQNTHLQKFGAIGVDIFFVISGFIIPFVANKYTGADQGFHFLKKRFIRINLIYYIASLFLLFVNIFRAWIIHRPALSAKENISSFIDTLLVVPTTETTATYLPTLRIGWTLSVEWLFYFLFFLVIVLGVRYKLVTLAVIVVVLITMGYAFPPADLRYAFITNPIMLEFLLGTLIFWIYTNVKTIHAPIPLSLLTIGIIAYILLITYGYGEVWNSFYVRDVSMKRFFLWGLPSSFIVAGCIFSECSNRFQSLWNNKPMQLIGNASYSIYLVHITTYALITIVYIRVGFFIPADLTIFLQFFIAILAGIGFYKLVERPLLQALHQWKPELRPKSGKLLLGASK